MFNNNVIMLNNNVIMFNNNVIMLNNNVIMFNNNVIMFNNNVDITFNTCTIYSTSGCLHEKELHKTTEQKGRKNGLPSKILKEIS
jgi:hypothetical protein